MTGPEIRSARERAGMTQQQLAAKVEVGLRTVGNWERGETVPQNRMAKLEAVLGPWLNEPTDDPLRAATDAELLAELQRRAAVRDRSAS